MIGSLLYHTMTRPDIHLTCVCVLASRLPRALPTRRLSNRSRGTFVSLQSLVYGTICLSSFLCVVIQMLVLRDATCIACPLLGLVILWDLHWFPGLLVNSLALPSLP
jgi:hypothetical protein